MQRTQIKGNVIFGRVRKHRIRSKICGSNFLVLGRQSRVRWHRPWLRVVTSLWRRRLGDKCHETIVKHPGRVKLKAPLDSWACYSDLLDFSAFFSTHPVVTGIQFSFVERHRKAFPFFQIAWKLESFVCQANKSKTQTTNWGGYVLKLLKQAPLTPDMEDFLKGPSRRFHRSQQVVSVLWWVLRLLLVTWRGSSWHEDLQAGIP